MKTRLFVSSVVGVSLLAGVAGPLTAQGKRTPEAAYRHNVMEMVKYSIANISAILRGDVPYSEQIVHETEILANAAAMAKRAFEIDTRGHNTETSSEDAIWENWEDFARRMDTFSEDTGNLATVAKSGDKGETLKALRTVFGNCKGCHDNYRKEH